jgi:hypothetical protein
MLFRLPPPFHTGTPHMDTGTVYLAIHLVTHRRRENVLTCCGITIKKILPPLARREFQTPDNTQHQAPVIRNSESPMSASHRTSRRTYHCSRSCFAAGATAARRARRASDGGDVGGDARGATTTTVEARILSMLNSRTTRETSLPPPSLGIS